MLYFIVVLVILLLISNIYLIGTIMQTQIELAQALSFIKDQLVKASAEIVERVAALEVAVANAGMTSAEVDAAVDGLKAIAQSLDDMNPDAVV